MSDNRRSNIRVLTELCRIYVSQGVTLYAHINSVIQDLLPAGANLKESRIKLDSKTCLIILYYIIFIH